MTRPRAEDNPLESAPSVIRDPIDDHGTVLIFWPKALPHENVTVFVIRQELDGFLNYFWRTNEIWYTTTLV
jgi:hypothetical protein